MYELPNLKDVQSCSVDESAIKGDSPVKMITENAHIDEIDQNKPDSDLKSA